MQAGLQPYGRAVPDPAPDTVFLFLGPGQEPAAWHLLSVDKRINLVTNNGAIKPFIWLMLCCQLLSKSSMDEAGCAQHCHVPSSSILTQDSGWCSYPWCSCP